MTTSTATVSPHQHVDPNEESNPHEAVIIELTSDNESLRTQLTASSALESQLRSQLESTQEKNEKLETEVKSLTSEILSLQTKCQQIQEMYDSHFQSYPKLVREIESLKATSAEHHQGENSVKQELLASEEKVMGLEDEVVRLQADKEELISMNEGRVHEQQVLEEQYEELKKSIENQLQHNNDETKMEQMLYAKSLLLKELQDERVKYDNKISFLEKQNVKQLTAYDDGLKNRASKFNQALMQLKNARVEPQPNIRNARTNAQACHDTIKRIQETINREKHDSAIIDSCGSFGQIVYPICCDLIISLCSAQRQIVDMTLIMIEQDQKKSTISSTGGNSNNSNNKDIVLGGAIPSAGDPNEVENAAPPPSIPKTPRASWLNFNRGS